MRKVSLSLLLILFTFFKVLGQASGPVYAPKSSTSGAELAGSESATKFLSLNTGAVAFPVTLASVEGRNGLSPQITISYNSNIESFSRVNNSDASIGVLGLGWSLELPRIITDHKNTVSKTDDQYYLFMEGQNTELFFTGYDGASGKETYMAKQQNYFLIEFYPADLRWEVTDTNGNKYYYGGLPQNTINNNNAIDWHIGWDNWVGESANTVSQETFPIGYYLYRMENSNGDFANYYYEQTKGTVGSGRKQYTKAIRIKQVRTSLGSRIILKYIDSGMGTPTSPDASQEKLETNYLSEIISYNNENDVVARTVLQYQHHGTGVYSKRLLTAVSFITGSGEQLSEEKFGYVLNDTPNKYKLNQHTNGSGVVVGYTYNETGLDISTSRHKLINAPSGYAEPRVWIGGDYVVVTWRMLSSGAHTNNGTTIKVEVYTWDGEWVGKSLKEISGVKVVDGKQDFEVKLAKNCFGILANPFTNDGNVKYLHTFFRNSLEGAWHTEGVYSTEANFRLHLSFLAGEDYIATLSASGILNTYMPAGITLKRETINLKANGDAKDVYMATGANNYILVHQINGTDWLSFYYFDRKGNLQKKSINAPSLPTTGDLTYSKWYAANTFAVYTNNSNEHIVYWWNSDFSIFYSDRLSYQLPADSYKTVSGASLENSTFAIVKGDDKEAYALVGRFNGSGWGVQYLTSTKISNFAFGENIVLHQNSSFDILSKKYDQNRPGWDNSELLQNGGKDVYFSVGKKFFSSNGVTFYYDKKKELQIIFPPLGNYIQKGLISDVSSDKYILYNELYGGSIDRVIVQKLENDQFSETIGGISGSFEVDPVTDTDRADIPSLMAGNIFITYNSNNFLKFEDATYLSLYYQNNLPGLGKVQGYPLTKISITDGNETTYTSVAYDASTAKLDESGKVAQYHKVTVVPGSSEANLASNGRTEYYFINGLVNNNITNEEYAGKLTGTLYATKVFNNLNTEVASEETQYTVFTKDLLNRSGAVVDKAYYVRPISTTSVVDGVKSVVKSYYLPETGQLNYTETSDYGSKGKLTNYFTYYTYWWQAYDPARTRNLLNPIIQVKKKVNEKVISATATKWKDFGGGKWYPWQEFVWKGKGGAGSENFTAWSSSSSPSTDWLMTSEVRSRDEFGNVVESVDVEGKISAVVWGSRKTLPYMQAKNALASQLLYDDFNGDYADNDPITWQMSGSLTTEYGTLRKMDSSPGNTLASVAYSNSKAYILDFDVKFGTWNNVDEDYIAAQLNKMAASDLPTQSGLTLEMYASGYVKLREASGETLATARMENVQNWNSVKVVCQNNEYLVYINGKKEISISYNLTGQYFGFYSYSSIAEVDNFRMYPSDAYTISSSYHPIFKYVVSQAGDNGESVKFLYNDLHQQVASINHQGVPVQTSSFYGRYKDQGSLSKTDLSIIHNVQIRGSKGRYVDFSSPDNQWEVIDRPNGAGSTWKASGGKLVHTSSGGATDWSADVYTLDLKEELTGRVGIEYDLKAASFSSDWSFGMGLGGDAWDFTNGGTEGAVWTSIYKNEYRVYNETTYWQTAKAPLEYNRTYRIKVLLDTEKQIADYYVDGKLLVAAYPLRKLTTGIQKLAFFNYGHGSNSYWYIDNLVIYDDPIQSSTFVDATGKVRQVQSESANGNLMVGQTLYDALGRAAVSVKPTEVINAKFGYRPDFVKTYDWVNDVMTGEVVTLNPEDEGYPYSRTALEKSPLSRGVTSSRPGKELKLLEAGSYSSKNGMLTYANNSSISMGLSLPTGEYFVEKAASPDGAEVFVMKSKTGQVVAKQEGPFESKRIIDYNYSLARLQRGPGTRFSNFYFTAPVDHVVNFDVYLGDKANTFTTLKVGTTEGGNDIANFTLDRSSGKTSDKGSFIALKGVTYYFDLAYGSLTSSFTLAAINYKNVDSPVYDKDYHTTTYEYDEYGNVVAVYPPNYHLAPSAATNPDEYSTRMTYDHFGRIKNKVTPDNGTTKYIYNFNTGRLRYKQDANGAAATEPYFMYYEYDELGRVIEEGYIYQVFDENILTELANKPAVSSEEYVPYLDLQNQVIAGDYYANKINATGATLSGTTSLHATDEIVLGPGFIAAAGQSFKASTNQAVLTGRMVWRKRFTYGEFEEQITARSALVKVMVNNDEDANAEVEEYFSYDRNNRLVKKGTLVADYESVPQYVSYTYDNLGGALTEDYGASFGQLKYSYHLNGSLKSIGTIADEDKFVVYSYNKNGALKEEKLNNQAYIVNYDYYSAGWMKSITSNLFSEELRYTTRSDGSKGYYSGLIAQAKYAYAGSSVQPAYNYSYFYQYNNAGALVRADHTLNDAYDVGVTTPVAYDANGNLLTLERGSAESKITNSYMYDVNTNKVNRIQGANRQYFYDANGNVTQSVPKNLSQLSYDAFFNRVNKITRTINTTSVTTNFQYGGDNERIYKLDAEYNNQTVYYRGKGAYPVVEKSKGKDGIEHLTYYVYGAGGIVATYQDGQWLFPLKDHLGSTRVVMDEQNASIHTFDYLPFGGSINSSGSGELAYQYTSQEKDNELGLLNYRARLYDPELARFYGVDPKGQQHSPFAYAGSNPISNIDPDGKIFMGTLKTAVFDFWKTGLFDGGFDLTSSSARRNAWRDYDPTKQGTLTNNAWRIDKGFFQTDAKLESRGRIWQLISRFTWELPTTIIGNKYAHLANLTGDVERVDYFAGATVLWNANKRGGTAIGNYININSWEVDRNRVRQGRRPGFLDLPDELLYHEYGHYMQSRSVGGYLPILGGINSMLSTVIEDISGTEDFHDNTWWERDASQRSMDYMIKTGRVNETTDVNFIQRYYEENPGGKGKWWEFIMLPSTFLSRF